jgi:serine protease Do
MIHRFLLFMFLFAPVVSFVSAAHPAESNVDLGAEPNSGRMSESSDWSSGSEENSGGSSYLGVDIADVSAERLGELKLKEEHGAEITMVDQDAPAGKAGLHEHDVILTLNGAPVESAAQLRRMIKETPPGRVVTVGISRDGQPQTIKVQLADRNKSMAWEPKSFEYKYEIPKMPAMSDFELPISVVVVHSVARSGLMVENITPQLGDFFGVKDGNGVLVRSVEKASRGEKSGFRAGDVVVKVNGQAVHDTSDFSHALRSSSGGTATVTVIRDKREQTLTLTLPEKKDSGELLEESFDAPAFTAQMERAINRAGDEVALLGSDVEDAQQQAECSRETEKRRQERQRERQQRQKELQEEMWERRQELQEQQEEMREQQQSRKQELEERLQELREEQRGRQLETQEQQKEMQAQQQEMQQKLRRELSGQWAEI